LLQCGQTGGDKDERKQGFGDETPSARIRAALAMEIGACQKKGSVMERNRC